MRIAYVSTVIDASVEDVWSVLGDFHGIDRWVGRIRSAEPENGAGPGAVGRRYSYEFAGDQPYPVRAYRGTIGLLPVTDSGSTFAEWFGEFDCDAALADELTGQFTRIYAAFLDDLRRHVAAT